MAESENFTLGSLWLWLKDGLNKTSDGKIGLIFHVEKGRVSVEKIHNTKGKVGIGEDK